MFDLAYKLMKPLLFQLEPELVHRLCLMLANHFSVLARRRIIADSVELAGIKFPNKIGLAAGFDKNAEFLPVFEAMGFGHVEIGTVTPKPQFGNPRPRLFRFPEHKSLLNHMGFNNVGLDRVVKNLRSFRGQMILGASVGKNRETSSAESHRDYQLCIEALYPFVDYFTLNISSPNTPGLLSLQEKPGLLQLLDGLDHLQERLKGKAPRRRPILLKLSADLSERDLESIAEILKEAPVDGLVLVNTSQNMKVAQDGKLVTVVQ